MKCAQCASLAPGVSSTTPLIVDVAVEGDALRVSTKVVATGDRAVPVCFGWHPYLRLPGPSRLEMSTPFMSAGRGGIMTACRDGAQSPRS